MINLLEFQQLALNEQAEATFQGIYLGDRKEDKNTIQLYRVDEFYVEVVYEPDANQIKELRPTKRVQVLANYIDLRLN